MKKLLSCLLTALIVIGGLFGLYYYLFLYNNCRLPIKYSVGNVDNRFKITQNEVIASAHDATERWHNQTSDNLFIYDENSSLKINLIYDRRQTDVDEMATEVEKLTKSRALVENFTQGYDSLVTNYEQDLSKYNQEVDYWNSHGGAPPDIYQRFQQEKADLQARRTTLIDMANILNFQSQTYNENLDNLKNEIDKRKNIIVTQGLYDSDSNTINIYTFGNTDELRLVLMHELGHTLGIGHAQNPISVMYVLLDQQDLKNPQLTEEDKKLLGLNCHRLKFYLTQ